MKPDLWWFSAGRDTLAHFVSSGRAPRGIVAEAVRGYSGPCAVFQVIRGQASAPVVLGPDELDLPVTRLCDLLEARLSAAVDMVIHARPPRHRKKGGG